MCISGTPFWVRSYSVTVHSPEGFLNLILTSNKTRNLLEMKLFEKYRICRFLSINWYLGVMDVLKKRDHM